MVGWRWWAWMQAEVRSGLGSKGRGCLALRVVHCFPDPSCPPWLHCLAPSPFPNLLRLCAVPLSLTLRRQGWRLPASWVTHRLVVTIRTSLRYADTLDCLVYFFFPPPSTEAHVRYDLVVLFCTIRSDGSFSRLLVRYQSQSHCYYDT